MTEAGVLLLLSGGIDSLALLHFYLRRNEDVKCIHFNYNQPNIKSESEAVQKISKFYGIKTETLNYCLPIAYRGDEVYCRNTLFVLIAASLGYPNVRISLGIHSDSSYYDASDLFLEDCQRILDGYFSGSVKVEAPFIGYNKMDIIDYCQKYNVPLSLTYSCFRKEAPPCGECPSCLDRRKLDANI